MLLFSLFLAGFMLGVFMTLKVFSPETQEESWDPQYFPEKNNALVRESFTEASKPKSVFINTVNTG